MSQPTPREVLDRAAERLLRVPRGHIANTRWEALTLTDVLRVIEATAHEFGAEPRQWPTDGGR
jgi:hypothetical protein